MHGAGRSDIDAKPPNTGRDVECARPEPRRFRAVALIHVRDARRTLEACLANLVAQGLEAYVVDNGSTDGSRAIASSWVGRGVLRVDDVPWPGFYDKVALLERKEEVARRLDADWFLDVSSDEILLPPGGFSNVREALQAAEGGGFDAVRVEVYCFVPTVEEPDHDHPRFLETMACYYPYRPDGVPRRSVWKYRQGEIGLAASGGRQVSFEGVRTFPHDLVSRRYVILSRGHAVEKYCGRKHAIGDLGRGWHDWSDDLLPERIVLPRRDEVRPVGADGRLDPQSPASRHLFVRSAHPARRAVADGKSIGLFVLGMHRSGTSALTGCLMGLGARLGRPLLPAVPGDNERGYYELEPVMQLHDRLLSEFGATPFDLSSLPDGWTADAATARAAGEARQIVDAAFAGAELWALKDPRLCHLLPLWDPVLADFGVESRFVLVLRSPWSVARSLAKRGVPFEQAVSAWLAHTESAERLTRGRRRVVVRYEDLMARPVAELERVGRQLEVEWPSAPGAEKPRLEGFLDARLRSHSEGPAPREAGKALAAALESFFRAIAEGDAGPAKTADVDEAARSCHQVLADLGWREAGPAPEGEAYRVEWLEAAAPGRAERGKPFEVVASWRNVGRWPLSRHRLAVSYHWYEAASRERPVSFEGVRTPVGRTLPPGAREELILSVLAPEAEGRYQLEFDLVREDIAWFSWKGVAGPASLVDVTTSL